MEDKKENINYYFNWEHRNKGTGVVGVDYRHPSYIACWKESGPKTINTMLIRKSKCFNVKKYGNEQAFKMACELRKEMEEKHMKDGRWIKL